MRRLQPALLLLYFLTSHAQPILGNENQIYPDEVYFLYREESLRCGALYDPVPWEYPQNPAAEVEINLLQNWGCSNPEPYVGPDATHREVIVLGNTQSAGEGDLVYYLEIQLDLSDFSLVSRREARRIRRDPERAILEAIRSGLEGEKLSFNVSRSSPIPDAEIADHLYGRIGIEEEDDARNLDFNALSWLRLDTSAVDLSFDGYPRIIEYDYELITFFGYYLWYWRAKALWGLPIRARAHGYEPPTANPSITLEIDQLQSTRARTQSLRVLDGDLAPKISGEVRQKYQMRARNLPLEYRKSPPKRLIRFY